MSRQQNLALPILLELSTWEPWDLKEQPWKVLVERLASLYELSSFERATYTCSSRETTFDNDVRWAIKQLRENGYLEGEQRYWYAVSDNGLAYLHGQMVRIIKCISPAELDEAFGPPRLDEGVFAECVRALPPEDIGDLLIHSTSFGEFCAKSIECLSIDSFRSMCFRLLDIRHAIFRKHVEPFRNLARA